MRMRRAQTRRRLAAAASGSLALAAAALAAGCAFDWGFPADSSDGGGVDGSSTDAAAEAAPPRDGSGGDAPTGRPCTKSPDCSGSIKQYCHFGDYLCGNGVDPTGTCTNVPTGCANVEEVCSCDGQTYPNECTALANGSDLDKKKGFCPFDASTQFQCGTHICEQNKEYCLIGSSPVSYTCKSLTVSTGSCNPLSCTCPAILALVGCTCSGDPGSITLTGCPP